LVVWLCCLRVKRMWLCDGEGKHRTGRHRPLYSTLRCLKNLQSPTLPGADSVTVGPWASHSDVCGGSAVKFLRESCQYRNPPQRGCSPLTHYSYSNYLVYDERPSIHPQGQSWPLPNSFMYKLSLHHPRSLHNPRTHA